MNEKIKKIIEDAAKLESRLQRMCLTTFHGSSVNTSSKQTLDGIIEATGDAFSCIRKAKAACEKMDDAAAALKIGEWERLTRNDIKGLERLSCGWGVRFDGLDEIKQEVETLSKEIAEAKSPPPPPVASSAAASPQPGLSDEERRKNSAGQYSDPHNLDHTFLKK